VGWESPIPRLGDQEELLLLRLRGITPIALSKSLGSPLVEGLSNAIVELLQLLPRRT